MKSIQASLSLLCCSLLVVAPAFAQNAIRIDPPQGGLGWVTRPYQRRIIPEINTHNSDRLRSLVRAANLYLSGDDVISLALENNLDIEIRCQTQ